VNTVIAREEAGSSRDDLLGGQPNRHNNAMTDEAKDAAIHQLGAFQKSLK
jgi:hypothetical protein